MNFIRRLKTEKKIIFQTRVFQIWRLIRDMEVMTKYRISAQYLYNYAC